MRVLVTGGCGFIGSCYLRTNVLAHPDWQFLNLDKLGYAASPLNLGDAESQSNYQFVKADLKFRGRVRQIVKEFRPDWVLHFAAESHVDRSITAAHLFLQSNVVGTVNLLEACRDIGVKRFLHVSTDEVFGSLGKTGSFHEETRYDPSSPYSASKASADHWVRAFHRTYGFPALITNCSNNYGPYQFPEKLIPLMILNAKAGKPLPVYGDGQNVRDWLFVEDHITALETVIERGVLGETYCIGGRTERTNLAIVEEIIRLVGKGEITFVKDRLGHDFRYAIDTSKIERELGWKPKHSLEQGLAQTVRWYLENGDWATKVCAKDYQKWVRTHYGKGA